MNPKGVVICIITAYPGWYRGKLRSLRHTQKVRGDLALQTISAGVDKGYTVLVGDTKSSFKFKKELRETGAALVGRLSSGRSEAKKQLIRKAAKIPSCQIIVLTEPEKLSLITDCLPLALRPIIEKKAEIVIPGREEKLFQETYPGYMYKGEKEGNFFYNELLRSHDLIAEKENLDMYFGPRVFANTKKIVSLFLKDYRLQTAGLSPIISDPENFMDIGYLPVVLALKKGMGVTAVTVPFRYPSTQKENEEKGQKDIFIQKRHDQKLGFVVELIHFIAYLEKYRGTRISGRA